MRALSALALVSALTDAAAIAEETCTIELSPGFDDPAMQRGFHPIVGWFNRWTVTMFWSRIGAAFAARRHHG